MDKTLIYIHPGYDVTFGHFTRVGQSIREGSKGCGVEFKHFVNLDVPEDTANELGLIRGFKYKAGIQWVDDPVDALRDFYIKLDKLLEELPEKEEQTYKLLMYTGHPLHLPIVALLLNKHAGKRKRLSAYIYLFYLDLEFCRGNGTNEYKSMLKKISRLIELSDPGHLLNVCTDSQRTKRLYGPNFERELKILPVPIEASPEVVTHDESAENDKIRICYVGQTTKRAGYDIVYRAYKQISEMDIFESVEFKIKHTPKGQLSAIYSKFLLESQNITHVTEFLTNQALVQFFADSDIILLPYSRKNYPCQTSGMVVEALSRKKILIVPEDTWMSDQLKDCGSGETFLSDNLDSFVEAVVKIVKNFDYYKKRSNRGIQKFRDLHSTSNLFAEIGLKESCSEVERKKAVVQEESVSNALEKLIIENVLLLQQNQERDDEIKGLRNSWSWRVTAPLRWLYMKLNTEKQQRW